MLKIVSLTNYCLHQLIQNQQVRTTLDLDKLTIPIKFIIDISDVISHYRTSLIT